MDACFCHSQTKEDSTEIYDSGLAFERTEAQILIIFRSFIKLVKARSECVLLKLAQSVSFLTLTYVSQCQHSLVDKRLLNPNFFFSFLATTQFIHCSISKLYNLVPMKLPKSHSCTPIYDRKIPTLTSSGSTRQHFVKANLSVTAYSNETALISCHRTHTFLI